MQKKIQKNKIKTYLLFVFVLFIFVLYFTLKDNYKAILEALSGVKIIYLFFGILFVFMSRILVGVILYSLTKKEKKDIKIGKLLRISLIYPFFAGITPGSLGGESFEIFYLKQTGIPYGKATNITIQKYILYIMSLIIVNFVSVILNLFTDIVPFNGLVSTAIIINFVFNICVLGLLFLLAYNKKFEHFVMNKGLLFLNKIKIIKDIDKSKKTLDNFMDNFDDGVDKLKNDKKLFVKLICLSILSLVFLILVAYPIARSLNISDISGLNLFILSAFVKMMSLLIATPGNSGAAEYCFIYLFTGLLGEEDIMVYMLIWRFVTYYIPLITGGVLAITWGKEKKDEKIDCI